MAEDPSTASLFLAVLDGHGEFGDKAAQVTTQERIKKMREKKKVNYFAHSIRTNSRQAPTNSLCRIAVALGGFLSMAVGFCRGGGGRGRFG